MSWLNRLGLTLLVVAGLAFHPAPASATAPAPAPAPRAGLPKFALVIGNANYSGNRSRLKNPIHDASLMAETLRKIDFEVRLHTDLDRSQMVKAVADFSSALPAGATAFVYYAGHGMQIGGASYLIPLGMAVTSEQSVPLRAYPLKTLLERISASSSAVNVVVLDACRDNPFQPAPPVKYRNFNNLGLAPVQAPRGTVVAYSTQPGQLAEDGKDTNSVYTAALARVLLEPRMSLEDIFKRVNTLVRNTTRDDQIPWYESSLTEEYFFIPPPGVTVTAGRKLQTPGAEVSAQSRKRGEQNTNSAHASGLPLWYKSMSDSEWSNVDWEIQQRVKRLTPDEIPFLKRQAQGGNVMAMTTLGLAYLEGVSRATAAATGKVMRYQANNTLAHQWLQRAAKEEFPIAQAVLGELYYRGQGVQRDQMEALRLTQLAAKANYPRAKLNVIQLELINKDTNPQAISEALGSLIRAVDPNAENKPR